MERIIDRVVRVILTTLLAKGFDRNTSHISKCHFCGASELKQVITVAPFRWAIAQRRALVNPRRYKQTHTNIFMYICIHQDVTWPYMNLGNVHRMFVTYTHRT